MLRARGQPRSKTCVARALPDSSVVLFFDEPALVCWRDGAGPIEREIAIDLLSGALASTHAAQRRARVRRGRSSSRPRRRAEHRALRRRRVRSRRRGRGCRASSRAAAGSRGARSPRTGLSASRRLPLWKTLLDTWCELTAPRLRSGRGCARRRWSRPRAASPATARARPSGRCCSRARSAGECAITRPHASSPSAREHAAARSGVIARR